MEILRSRSSRDHARDTSSIEFSSRSRERVTPKPSRRGSLLNFVNETFGNCKGTRGGERSLESTLTRTTIDNLCAKREHNR